MAKYPMIVTRAYAEGGEEIDVRWLAGAVEVATPTRMATARHTYLVGYRYVARNKPERARLLASGNWAEDSPRRY